MTHPWAASAAGGTHLCSQNGVPRAQTEVCGWLREADLVPQPHAGPRSEPQRRRCWSVGRNGGAWSCVHTILGGKGHMTAGTTASRTGQGQGRGCRARWTHSHRAPAHPLGHAGRARGLVRGPCSLSAPGWVMGGTELCPRWTPPTPHRLPTLQEPRPSSWCAPRSGSSVTLLTLPCPHALQLLLLPRGSGSHCNHMHYILQGTVPAACTTMSNEWMSTLDKQMNGSCSRVSGTARVGWVCS